MDVVGGFFGDKIYTLRAAKLSAFSRDQVCVANHSLSESGIFVQIKEIL